MEWWVLPVIIFGGSAIVAVARVVLHNVIRRRQEGHLRRLRGRNDALVDEMMRQWPGQRATDLERWTKECEQIGWTFPQGRISAGSLWSDVREEIIFGGTIIEAMEMGDDVAVTDARTAWGKHRRTR